MQYLDRISNGQSKKMDATSSYIGPHNVPINPYLYTDAP